MFFYKNLLQKSNIDYNLISYISHGNFECLYFKYEINDIDIQKILESYFNKITTKFNGDFIEIYCINK